MNYVWIFVCPRVTITNNNFALNLLSCNFLSMRAGPENVQLTVHFYAAPEMF
jgi:hypothetical protein